MPSTTSRPVSANPIANGTCTRTGTITRNDATRATTPTTGRHAPGRPPRWMRWYGSPPDPVVATSAQRALEPGQRALAPEQLHRLEQRRRDPATGHGDADGTEGVAGLEPHAVDQRELERLLDRGGRPLREAEQRVEGPAGDRAAVVVQQLGGVRLVEG